MRNKPNWFRKLTVSCVAFGFVLIASAPKCMAQRFAEPSAPTGPTATPVPAINQCYLVGFDKSGSYYSQRGSLAFSEAFRGPTSGCLADKIESLKPMFLYRYWPDPSNLGPINKAKWQQGCEAHCDWLQDVQIKVVVTDEATWTAANCQNIPAATCSQNYSKYKADLLFFKEQFPLLSASEYLQGVSSSACTNKNCSDALTACKIRCGENLTRQCYWQSWCKTPAGEQRRFCGSDIASNLCPDRAYADDNALEFFMQLFFGFNAWPSGDTSQVSCQDAVPAMPSDAWKNANCKGLDAVQCEYNYGMAYTHVRGKCVTGSFALDGQCNLITKDRAKGCINTNVASIQWLASSPISLIWSAGHSLRENASVVNFKLDDSSSNTWYKWYGSAEAPLVVYDPKHTGRIESAHQLFGNWTFGGQRVASLALGASGPKPWENGYQALETLDGDGDGVIRGEELAPLGLWFDTNRDAKAQEGEVRDIRSAGVLSLSVGPQRKDALTGDVSVEKGFERSVDGRVEIGQTIDWFSDGAKTVQQLVVADQLRLPNSQNQVSESGADSTERSTADVFVSSLPHMNDPRDTYAADSKVTGLWLWGSKDETDLSSQQGMIAIRERKTGELEVVTVGELGVRDSTGTTRALQKFYMMTGRVEKGSDGSTKISFADPVKKGTESFATLDEANGILRGQTTQRIVEIKGTKSIKYSWEARRALR